MPPASSPWSIRTATPDDIDAIVEFNCGIARETEGKELDRATVRRGVQRGLARAPEVTYFVAEADGQLIGTLMLTREWSDWRDGWLAWLQSVYVVAAYRGQGVFSSLLEHATGVLQQDPDTRGLRLYVEHDNAVAQSVYQRNGFVDAHYRVLEKMFG